jgi:oxygen-dependent protoporphyrinogen oxidase
VRRRLGQPYLDTLVGPFVSGVYAGDPEKLSVRWAVKVIHGLEQEHGSLIRGALARRKGPAPGGRLVSFPEGLEELPRALARSLGTDLYLNAEVTGLAQANGGFLLETKEQGGIGRLRAERVILAAPADAASRLLSALGPSERCDLAGIPYAPVVSVALGFRDQNLGARLKGFGFLVPRVEDLTILGCLFSSSLFEGRAPEGCVALTVLVGGATQPEILQMDEAALLAMVLRDLRKALGALPDPIFRHVTRWPRAIPQYNLGHGRFVEAARLLEEAFPGIHVGGNLLEGVSLADCIRNARSLADSIIESVIAKPEVSRAVRAEKNRNDEATKQSPG